MLACAVARSEEAMLTVDKECFIHHARILQCMTRADTLLKITRGLDCSDLHPFEVNDAYVISSNYRNHDKISSLYKKKTC